MSHFQPKFLITNSIARDLTTIERARGFFQAATLSDQWIARMSERALLLEAYHSTHIEGTQLTFEQSEILLAGGTVEGASPDDVRELLNYRDAFCMYCSGYDFKRLFTISEYYDRDRRAFYDAIQGVRDCGMDHTGWLEFFCHGLATQMAEAVERGTRAIKADVMRMEFKLNERQLLAVEHLLAQQTLSIAEYEQICPGSNRRTLQRDLKRLVELGVIVESTSSPTDPNRGYRLKEL